MRDWHPTRKFEPFRARLRRALLGVLLLVLMTVPHVFPDYVIAQLTLVCIYAIAGLGMALVLGVSGQISLGHAAFLALGAYAAAILQGFGVPFLVSLPIAGALAGAVGGIVGFLFARLSGPYFAMATIAFAAIVKEVIVRWEELTNGNLGIHLEGLSVVSISFAAEGRFYYLVLVVLMVAMVTAAGLWNSAAGRAMSAVRDDELAAKSAGIDSILYKTAAFGISAFWVGLAGALYAHKILYISPDAFGFGASLELLVLAVVGGLTALSGAVWGALFVIVLPQAISLLGGYVPLFLAERASAQGLAYGAALIAVLLIEPRGIYGLLARASRRFAGGFAGRMPL